MKTTTTPTDEKRAELLKSAAHWEQLADDQEPTAPGRARADLYRNTGRALRMEAADGTPRCSCCLKPFGAHR